MGNLPSGQVEFATCHMNFPSLVSYTSGTTQENTEILTHLVTIFPPPFRFLEYIKHVGLNSILYTFLQVCRCYGTQFGVLTKAS